MTENELRHYGILGMKWGVRRTESQLARARGKKVSSDSNSSKEKKITKENAYKAINKGSKAVGNILVASMMDDIFYGGRGKKALKSAGRAAVTSVLKRKGYSDIRWYD